MVSRCPDTVRSELGLAHDFERCGLVSTDDFRAPSYERTFRMLEQAQAEFLAADSAFRSPDYLWDRDALHEWLMSTLSAAREGSTVPFAIVAADSGRVLGSTRFLELRFEHLRAEIGWTWVTRSAWSTGVNVETKLLLLEHAFERVGLRRVEFKTDARNERSRGALLAAGATFASSSSLARRA